LTRNGSAYVVYHGTMFITEVGTNFDRETHLGAFPPPPARLPGHRPRRRLSFGTDGGVQYMFYEVGPRLGATIAVARAIN
jgi:hypothetical protein